ncbi:MAG TPA: hypothetical protein VMV05_06315 [bacterium]|nr:hypothetical protein [bacterium]
MILPTLLNSRLRPFPARNFLFPFLLLFVGCAEHAPGKGPHDVFFAYGNGDGIYVVSGDGSVNQKVIGGAYYQAALSPDKTKIACVYDKDFQITIFDLDENFGSRGKPKVVFNSQAAAQGSPFAAVCCPTWSPDGQKVYFLSANHLIVYDYQEKKTSSLFDFPEGQLGGQTAENGDMKLSKEGDSLDVMLSEGTGRLAFWAINLGSNQGIQVASAGRDLLASFNFPPDLPADFIERLFGSRENPVLGPVDSPDSRFFFYFKKEQGFLARKIIEGYDRNSKEKFDVTTLGVSIYSN